MLTSNEKYSQIFFLKATFRIRHEDVIINKQENEHDCS